MNIWRALSGSRAFWPGVVFASSFSAYAATLPHTVSFEDSAEFVTAAATLGITHPSGYPLYVLLGHIFTWLPFGTVPWRVALLSAVAAAGALTLMFIIARWAVELARQSSWWERWFGRSKDKEQLTSFIMAAVIMAAGFTEIWWSQAIYAKVYSLHVFLCLLVTWCALTVGVGQRRMWWLGLSLGAALSVHLYLTLMMVPFWAVVVWHYWPTERRRDVSGWLTLVAGVLLGLLPYLYLPWRHAVGVPYAMDEIGSFGDLVGYLARQRYGDVGGGGAAWNKFGLVWTGVMRPLWELGPLLVALAAAGAFNLWRSRGRMVLVAMAGLFSAAPLVSLIISIGWTTDNEYLFRVFGLTGFAAAVILVAVGAAGLAARASISRRRWTAGAVAVGLVLLPVLGAANTVGSLRFFRDDFVETVGRAMLASLPPAAVLVVNDPGTVGDTELFVLAYLQIVEKLRPDVTVVDDVGISAFRQVKLPSDYLSANLEGRRRLMLQAVLADESLRQRPIYTSFAADYLGIDWRSFSTGVVFGLNEAVVKTSSLLDFMPSDLALRRAPLGYAALASHVAYAQVAAALDDNDRSAWLAVLPLAIEFDAQPFSDDYRGFVAYRAARETSVVLESDRH